MTDSSAHRSLFAALPPALNDHLLLSVTDAEGRIIDVNEAFCTLTGYPREELLGQNHRLLKSGAHPAEHFADLYATLGAGDTWQGTFENRTRRGEPFWIQATVIPLADSATAERTYLMVSTDVSARERRRQAYEELVEPGFGTATLTGIARAIARGLGCRGAAVARLEPDGTRLRMVGTWFDGAAGGQFDYAIAGTPCEVSLAGGHAVALVVDAQQQGLCFPPPIAHAGLTSYRGTPLHDEAGQVIGVLCAVDDKPFASDPNEEAFMKIAAARASAELARETAAEKIRESEARMRFALDAAALGMWEWDLENNSWVYNDRWAEMRGYRQGEITPNFDDWHPDDKGRLQVLVDRLLSGKVESYEVDYRTIHRDGSWRWINARTKVMKRAPDGRALRVVGIQMDIHERRLAEEAARANQQWLQLTIDATELGVWDWNGTTDRITWSPRCASMLGYTLDELPRTAKAWTALNHPDDQPEAHRQFVAHVRGEIPLIRVELRALAKDGHWVWIASHGRVIERDADGRALRAVGTHLDISQLKNAEIALRESEARLRAVVENSPIGIFLADAGGAILFCNQPILAMSGYPEPGRLGYEWEQYVHPDDLVRVRREWLAYSARPEGVYDLEWRAVIPGVGERQIRIRASAIREGNRVFGFAGALEDVTEQRAAERRERVLERQLQQTQKLEAIGKLTGGIAHDFNNSLATVLGFASLALRRSVHDAKLHDYLETIVQAAEHSRDLVRKMLDFSRSAPTGDIVPTVAADRIADATHMLQAVIPSTIRIVTEVYRESPPVMIDATDLHQILLNLALNARDAIGGHGEIRIMLRPPARVSGLCTACQQPLADEYVELSVSDDGCGIPGQDLSRIFDPFYSTKEVGKGSGMGLSVIHGIVHRAGGHVQVESTPGRGTCVRVLLRAAEQEVARHAAPASPTHTDFTQMTQRPRVLVVDDEPAIVHFLCELLEAQGYLTDSFTDPRVAHAWATRPDAAFDVLVTDQTMPGMTGLELVAALRALRPGLPVILCTGLVDRIGTAQAGAESVDALFLKPIPIPEFLATLERTLNPVPHSAGTSPS